MNHYMGSGYCRFSTDGVAPARCGIVSGYCVEANNDLRCRQTKRPVRSLSLLDFIRFAACIANREWSLSLVITHGLTGREGNAMIDGVLPLNLLTVLPALRLPVDLR